MIRRKGYIKRSTTPIRRTSLARSTKRIARTSRPARIRRTERAALEQRADALWRAKVKSPGKCRMCGDGHGLEAAHGISRWYRGTRFDLRNGFCLCHCCHRWMTDHPQEWKAYLRAELGPVYEELKQLARAKTTPDYEAVIAVLEASPE